MVKRRQLVSLLWALGLALCTAVLLAGCDDGFSLAPREPVTIRCVFPGGTEMIEPLVEAFQNEHKHITVEMVDSPFLFYRRAEPEEFDVALVPPFNLEGLVEDGEIIGLSSLVTEDDDFSMDDFYQGAVDSLMIQGQPYAIPYASSMAVMVYNRDLFDKHNVPYPQVGWTWPDFLETAKSLTHEDAGEYGYAYQQVGGQLGFVEPLLLVYQHGGRMFDSLANPSRGIVNEPLTVEAIQWYADLIHRHRVAAPPGNRQIPYPISGITGGKYAMWVAFIEDEYDDLNVGYAPLPRDVNQVTMGTVYGLAISSNTVDPDAAWEWLSYLSSQPPVFLMPTRRSVAESDDFAGSLSTDAVDAARASLPHLISLNMAPDSPMSKRFGFVTEAWATAIGKIQNGEPVQAALDEAQRKLN